LLTEAKDHHRPGLGVAVLRRGGERARWVSRWETSSGDAVTHLETLVTAMGREQGRGTLSARLAMGLERDLTELAGLNGEWRRMELVRRAGRHGISAEGAKALLALGSDGEAPTRPLVAATLAAQFIAAESRRS
jgi:hypothetical protein